MPHFLLFIFSSMHILSMSLLSKSVLRLAGRSDLKKVIRPPPYMCISVFPFHLVSVGIE